MGLPFVAASFSQANPSTGFFVVPIPPKHMVQTVAWSSILPSFAALIYQPNPSTSFFATPSPFVCAKPSVDIARGSFLAAAFLNNSKPSC